jgi:hypothetical protein
LQHPGKAAQAAFSISETHRSNTGQALVAAVNRTVIILLLPCGRAEA